MPNKGVNLLRKLAQSALTQAFELWYNRCVILNAFSLRLTDNVEHHVEQRSFRGYTPRIADRLGTFNSEKCRVRCALFLLPRRILK